MYAPIVTHYTRELRDLNKHVFTLSIRIHQYPLYQLTKADMLLYYLVFVIEISEKSSIAYVCTSVCSFQSRLSDLIK